MSIVRAIPVVVDIDRDVADLFLRNRRALRLLLKPGLLVLPLLLSSLVLVIFSTLLSRLLAAVGLQVNERYEGILGIVFSSEEEDESSSSSRCVGSD